MVRRFQWAKKHQFEHGLQDAVGASWRYQQFDS
jgi:hypothetical protein